MQIKYQWVWYIYANSKPSPVPISPSWTAYSYNSEFMSLSASNAISVMGMWRKEWKMMQSQPAALGPVPVQGFGHPRKCWLEDGQAREGVGLVKNLMSSGHLKLSLLPSGEWDLEGWNSHMESTMDKELPCCSLQSSQGQVTKRNPCSCCASHGHCSSPHPSHFHHIYLTFPQHKLL